MNTNRHIDQAAALLAASGHDALADKIRRREDSLQRELDRRATKEAKLRARIAELESKAADGTDWKAIAIALGKRVNWVISHISERGTGLVLNTNTGESRHWKVYMAEALRMIPGVTINDDILAAHCLPAGEKRKRFKQLAKRDEQEDSSHEQS